MKTLLLLLFAPDYLRDMPENAPGQYEAVAMTVSPWYQRERFTLAVEGRRAAYRLARWEALKLDWSTPDKEVGIMWAVRKVAA